MAIRSVVICIVGAFCAASAAHAGTITYDFNDGTLGGLIKTNDPGYSATVGGGVVTVSNPAGTPAGGRVTLTTPFTVSGDFTASFVGNRTGIGNSQIGIQAGADSTALADIFFQRSNVIAANAFKPFVFTLFQDPNNSSTVTLSIARQGNTLTETYNDGVVNVSHSHTDASLAAPVTLALFLVSDLGDTGAHTGTLDNFTITSASVPEPTCAGLLLVAGIPLTGRRRRSALLKS